MSGRVVLFGSGAGGEVYCEIEPMPEGIKDIIITNNAVRDASDKSALEKMDQRGVSDPEGIMEATRDADREIVGQPIVPTTCDMSIMCDRTPRGKELRKALLPISVEKNESELLRNMTTSCTVAWNNMDRALKIIGIDDDTRQKIIEKAGTMRAR